MSTIRYSVIIPHRNCADLTRRCLMSVPDREDIEIIVVDDNSKNPEELRMVQEELSTINAQFIYTTEGRGAGYARNVGLSHAKGEWLVFTDADDFFEKNAFDIFDKFINDNYDIVYFPHTSVYSETLEPCLRFNVRNDCLIEYLKESSDHNEEKLKFGDVVPWGKIFRRSVVEQHKIKFDEVPASNDVMFVTQAAYYAKQVHVCEEPVYVLTYRKGSITRVINKENEYSRFRVSLRFNNFLQEKGLKHLQGRNLSRVLSIWRNLSFKDAVFLTKEVYANGQSLFTGLGFSLNDVKKKIKSFSNKNTYRA